MNELAKMFYEQGYVVVEDVIDPTPLIADYTDHLEKVASMAVENGWLQKSYAGYPFGERWAAVLQHADRNLYRYFDITFPHEPITAETPAHLSRSIYDLIRSLRLLDVIEMLIGEEILANPIQHVRIKPPQTNLKTRTSQSTLVQKTGWHQDQGVAREEADATEMITAWVAVTDATEENGCMQVIPYSHRAGLAQHCPYDVAMEIPDQYLAGEPVSVPIRAGSVLLMHRLMQHASLPNISRDIRWSFDLRYQPIGQPTGRAEMPEMVVRSKTHHTPTYTEWVAAWEQSRAQQAKLTQREKMHRWDANAPTCA